MALLRGKVMCMKIVEKLGRANGAAALTLTKCSSNSSLALQTIPDKDRASWKSLISSESDPAGVYPVTKALDYRWETTPDRFVFRNEWNSLTSSSETLHTKRGVASLTAKVSDGPSLRSRYGQSCCFRDCRAKALDGTKWCQKNL